MLNNQPLKSFVFLSGAGCLLPALIIFNFLFGWIFFKPLHWLIIEGVLILLFVIKGLLFTRRIISNSPRKHGNAIDVEAEVVEDRRRLK
ncbi:MAG: hypothetical protein PHW54_06215 [Candidatus Omnitrophica bacterium]|nr:hypothetical protein [Candidatus Omnitrophota bacterium]